MQQNYTIINFFESENKEYWLEKIKESDWGAGTFLYEIIKNGSVNELIGETSKILLLIKDKELISYCTLAEKDDIQPTNLTPWIGFLYTFPMYRRQRYSEKLLGFAEILAKNEGNTHIYISTNHIGLYEKFGYEFFGMMKDMNDEDSRVYRKAL